MSDCRKSFKVYVMIDVDSQRCGSFDKPLETKTFWLPERWKRHGKKGRRANKQERAPRGYMTHWWDQPRTGVSKAVD